MAKKNWRERVRGIWKGLREAGAEFSTWFRRNVAPELQEFLNENKDVAMKIVLAVARDLALAPNASKRREALRRIDDRLLGAVPGVKMPTHWLELLLDVAVAALKASGKI